MKITVSPEHIVVVEAEIDTDGVTVPLTVILVVPDVAVVGLAQVELDVITQYTCALLNNAGVVYVEPLPDGLPFKYH